MHDHEPAQSAVALCHVGTAPICIDGAQLQPEQVVVRDGAKKVGISAMEAIGRSSIAVEKTITLWDYSPKPISPTTTWVREDAAMIQESPVRELAKMIDQTDVSPGSQLDPSSRD